MKIILKKCMLFVTLIFGLFILQVLVNIAIPKQLVEKSIKESSNYYKKNNGIRINLIKNEEASKEDVLADSVWLNIIYNFDKNKPVKSTLASSYYVNEKAPYGINLYNTVNNNIMPNSEYYWYWHGTTVLLRPLLVYFNINELKIVNIIILIVCMLIFQITCFRYNKKYIGICFILAFLLTKSFYIVASMEYMPVYIIMLLSCSYLIKNIETINIENYLITIGVLTSFFDFLTTETIPLLMSLIIVYCNTKEFKLKKNILSLTRMCLIYIVSYCSTFIVKWILNIVINNLDVNLAINRVLEKSINVVSKTVYGDLTSIMYNISLLFNSSIINYPTKFITILIVVIIIYLSVLYLLKKNKIEQKNLVIILLIIAILPIIRFKVLNFHSFLYRFFTYRALIATIMSLLLVFYYCIDFRIITESRIVRRLKNVLNNINAMFKRRKND